MSDSYAFVRHSPHKYYARPPTKRPISRRIRPRPTRPAKTAKISGRLVEAILSKVVTADCVELEIADSICLLTFHLPLV